MNDGNQFLFPEKINLGGGGNQCKQRKKKFKITVNYLLTKTNFYLIIITITAK